MKRFNGFVLSALLAASAVGCATAGQPASKGDEEEAQTAAAAKNESAPKPPSSEKIEQAQQQQQVAAKQPEPPKVSASVKAEFDGAVKKWEAAKKAGTERQDCRSLSSSFARISEPKLAAQAHFNAGTILEACGDDKGAESEYNAALSANPGYSPALNNLGELYYKQNNPATAKSWFEKAIQADPRGNAPAYNNLAAILYQQGKQSGDRALYTQAISNLRRALAIDAYSLPAYGLLALVYYTIAENDRAKLDLAELVCSQGKELDKSYPPLYNTLGLINLRKKYMSVALKNFEQAVSLDPKYLEAHLNIGAIGLSTRQYEKAATAFAAVLKLDPKNLDATVGMGVASRGLKKIEEAESWYKKAADLDPKNCAIQYNMGVLYQDYKSDPANNNLNTAKDYFSKYRGCSNTNADKVKDSERRIKDIDDMFVALEQAKKMEAENKIAQEQMEKQQKEMEAQEKAQQEAAKKSAAPADAKGAAPADAKGAAPADAKGATPAPDAAEKPSK
jgi:tetratricopeptide (TPR) repeat protein